MKIEKPEFFSLRLEIENIATPSRLGTVSKSPGLSAWMMEAGPLLWAIFSSR
ncbi:hypothetical protein MMU07_01580 [Aquiflexum sp. LQ15W]|uniref:hypothetical protein n=1 Tax=Cognataquiflexum nitidum TaxID=2922272 RepID=UPI001F14004A|nr:hypothetical protein [Cognataquiflexum nitidum]MCH6198254.1 hypothetical protein [Cognataquiflexum nitidum]